MKAAVYRRYGSPDVITVEDVPKPQVTRVRRPPGA